METVGSHRQASAAGEPEDDPCEQAFKEDYRAALYLRLIQSPRVFQVALETQSPNTFALCRVDQEKRRFKDLTKKCFIENKNSSEGCFMEGTKPEVQRGGRYIWRMAALPSGSAGMSSSARAAPPPVLEVSCFIKTLHCAGPEAAEGSRELEIEVSAWMA